MVVTLVLVALLMGIGGAFMAVTYVENQGTVQTGYEVLCKQSDSAALDKARLLLYENRAGGGNWNAALAASHTAYMMSGYQVPGHSGGSGSTSGGYDYMVSTLPAAASSSASGVSPASFYGLNFSHGDTVYNVLAVDDDDGDGTLGQDANDTVVVFTTVAAPAQPAPGMSRKILGVSRAVVFYQPPQYVPQSAILVGGSLKIGGNPSVLGAQGSIHTNGDLIVSGNPTISQTASATGTVSVTGSPTIGGGTSAGAAPVALPVIDPVPHLGKAKYVLENDGKVYDNTTTPRTQIAADDWNGFSWSASQSTWKKTGSEMPPAGPIYVNSHVEITGGGSAEAPWVTTLFVSGHVKISGNPVLRPFEGTVNGQALKNVAILAKGDVGIKGTGSSQADINGLIATHEQVDIGGTPTFTGSILAEDAEDVFGLVTSVSYIDILGNFTLTYNGGMDTFLTAGGTSVKLRSWEKYR